MQVYPIQLGQNFVNIWFHLWIGMGQRACFDMPRKKWRRLEGTNCGGYDFVERKIYEKIIMYLTSIDSYLKKQMKSRFKSWWSALKFYGTWRYFQIMNKRTQKFELAYLLQSLACFCRCLRMIFWIIVCREKLKKCLRKSNIEININSHFTDHSFYFTNSALPVLNENFFNAEITSLILLAISVHFSLCLWESSLCKTT